MALTRSNTSEDSAPVAASTIPAQVVTTLPNLVEQQKDRRIAQASAHAVYLERAGRSLRLLSALHETVETHSMKQAYDRRSWQFPTDMNAVNALLEQALRALGAPRLPD